MILRGLHLVGDGSGAREVVVSGSTLVAAPGDPSREGPALDFGGALAFPGLVNSHDHLEFDAYPALGHGPYGDYREWGDDIHRKDRDVVARVQSVPKSTRLRWGALKNLLCGVTTVAHHGDLRDDLASLPVTCIRATSVHSVGTGARWRWRLNAPTSRPPYVFHVAEGTSRRARHEVDRLLRWNLLRRPLVGVHAIPIERAQATAFHALVWCPLSNEFLYDATADVAAWKGATTILFGTDSTLTADWNFWNHLRRARALGPLDDPALFSSVTSRAALAWGIPRAGLLAPGYAADLVVARKKSQYVWDAFFAVEPEDILLVLRGGTPVLCDATVDGIQVPSPSSKVRIGATTKYVAGDVESLLLSMRAHGVTPNLPLTVPA